MIGGNTCLRWQVVVTHVPSGETVTLTSEHHKNQHAARDAGVKLIKARLLAKRIEGDDFTYIIDDFNSPPDNLFKNRRK